MQCAQARRTNNIVMPTNRRFDAVIQLLREINHRICRMNCVYRPFSRDGEHTLSDTHTDTVSMLVARYYRHYLLNLIIAIN